MQLLKYEQEQKPKVDKIKAEHATAVIVQKIPKAKTLAVPFVAKVVVMEVVKLLKWFALLMRLSIYIFFNKQHVSI